MLWQLPVRYYIYSFYCALSSDDAKILGMTQSTTPSAQGQTHWEVNSSGSLSVQPNATPMNNEVQLRNDRMKLAQSMPLDTLAQYKDALASGDAAKMDKVTDKMTPGQVKLMREIEARDPMTQVKGVTNLAIATGAISGLASLGSDAMVGGLTNPSTTVLSMSNQPPAPMNMTLATPKLGVSAPSLPTPEFIPSGMV